ncbi:MAG: hypothetical protein WCH39_05800 [Schlesneria sp.]
MTGAPRKPATKLPHLRKQMQKNQNIKGAAQLKTLRFKQAEKKKPF